MICGEAGLGVPRLSWALPPPWLPPLRWGAPRTQAGLIFRVALRGLRRHLKSSRPVDLRAEAISPSRHHRLCRCPQLQLPQLRPLQLLPQRQPLSPPRPRQAQLLAAGRERSRQIATQERSRCATMAAHLLRLRARRRRHGEGQHRPCGRAEQPHQSSARSASGCCARPWRPRQSGQGGHPSCGSPASGCSGPARQIRCQRRLWLRRIRTRWADVPGR